MHRPCFRVTGSSVSSGIFYSRVAYGEDGSRGRADLAYEGHSKQVPAGPEHGE